MELYFPLNFTEPARAMAFVKDRIPTYNVFPEAPCWSVSWTLETKRGIQQLRASHTHFSRAQPANPAVQVNSSSHLGYRTGKNLSPSQVTFPVLPSAYKPETETTLKLPNFPCHLQLCNFINYFYNTQKCSKFKTFKIFAL